MKQVPKKLTKFQIKEIVTNTDCDIKSWVRRSGFSTYTEKWFIAARDEAIKSIFHTAKIGCVIVYKNHIIGRGYNQVKTDPFQKKYNQKYRSWTNSPEFSNTCGHTIHAEIDALKNVKYSISSSINWKKAEMYIYRVAPGLEGYSGLSLPCEACAHAIQDIGIQKVYYTTGRIEKPFGYCEL